MTVFSWTHHNLEMSWQLDPFFPLQFACLNCHHMLLYLWPDSSTTDFFEGKSSLLTLGFGSNLQVLRKSVLQLKQSNSRCNFIFDLPWIFKCFVYFPRSLFSSLSSVSSNRLLEWILTRKDKDNPICKTEKETQMYRTDFGALWEKARVGCSERIALKQAYYHG